MLRGFGIFRPSTWVSLTKYAIVFIVAMNLARLEHLTGRAAAIAAVALAVVLALTWLGILPLGGDKPEWRRLIRRHRRALTKRYRQLVRVNAYGDYGVANALGLVSLVLASSVAWIYLRQSLKERA